MLSVQYIAVLTKRLTLQADGEQKLLVLRKLQKGKLGLMKCNPSSTAIQVEPDGDNPQIGYKDLPQKSLCALAAPCAQSASWTVHVPGCGKPPIGLSVQPVGAITPTSCSCPS